jgi:hypothetical protein
VNRDDILRMAREVHDGVVFMPEELIQFAELVAADAERKLGALMDDCEKHVDELQEANEKLGKREDWWNEKLFQAQERIKADTALLREALDCLENHVMQRTHAGGVVICNTTIALRKRLEGKA